VFDRESYNKFMNELGQNSINKKGKLKRAKQNYDWCENRV
jgi:hypothetical protein